MTPEKIAEINNERLTLWAKDLTKAHATPAVLIGVGHDHADGELHILIPEEMSNETLFCLLSFALGQMSPIKRGKP